MTCQGWWPISAGLAGSLSVCHLNTVTLGLPILVSSGAVLAGTSMAGLAGCVPSSASKEDPDMQVVLTGMVVAIAAAVDAEVRHNMFVADTHSSSNELSSPTARPDCSLFHRAAVPLWPSL